YASDVKYTKDGGTFVWQAHQGWEREFTVTKKHNVSTPAVTYRTFAEQRLPLEAPRYFKDDQPEADRMTYRELPTHVTQLQKSGYYSVPYQVQLQRKVAFPFVTLIMTLLAVPFAVTTGRSGALYGIGIGIALAIVYWTAQSIFGAMGSAGLVSPGLAA